MINTTTAPRSWGIDSFTLHIIAMVLMLNDHMWATVIHGNMWMTNIGRATFPIFAFMIVEGAFYTKNYIKYMQRMLLFAIISELPFNLMYGGEWIYPYHQNVMWTLLLGLICIWLVEKLRNRFRYGWIPLSVLIFAAGALISTVTMLDYPGSGILMIAVFYYARGTQWWNRILQFLGLYWVNVIVMKGMLIDLPLFGTMVEVPQQGLALLALIPIWLYNGKQGIHNRYTKYGFYLFYPVHMLVLSLISLYLL